MYSPMKASEHERPKRHNLMEVVGLIEGDESRYPRTLPKGQFRHFVLRLQTGYPRGHTCSLVINVRIMGTRMKAQLKLHNIPKPLAMSTRTPLTAPVLCDKRGQTNSNYDSSTALVYKSSFIPQKIRESLASRSFNGQAFLTIEGAEPGSQPFREAMTSRKRAMFTRTYICDEELQQSIGTIPFMVLQIRSPSRGC